jgi:hypothetical protein
MQRDLDGVVLEVPDLAGAQEALYEAWLAEANETDAPVMYDNPVAEAARGRAEVFMPHSQLSQLARGALTLANRQTSDGTTIRAKALLQGLTNLGYTPDDLDLPLPARNQLAAFQQSHPTTA